MTRGLLVPPVLLLLARTAAAEPCGRPDLLDAFPADGAVDVPTNARLKAHYAATAEWLEYDPEDAVVLTRVRAGSAGADAGPAGPGPSDAGAADAAPGDGWPGDGAPGDASTEPGAPDQGDAEELQVTFDDTTGILQAIPVRGLEAGAAYELEWPRLRGIGTASLGSGRKVSFTVGSAADEEDPVFEGLTGLDWDVEREDDDCTDRLEDRFVFDLRLGTASDDAPRGLLALQVFQSKGPDVEAPVPVTTVPLPEKNWVRVVRSLDDGAGRVCFSAVVRDLAGHVSGGSDREVCATTRRPPFFYGCRFSSAPAPAPVPAVLGASLLALYLRRRHRPAP